MAVAGIAVLLGVWFWLPGRHTSEPARNTPPASPERAELLRKPVEKTAKPVDATSTSKAAVLFSPPEPSAGKKLDLPGPARMQAALSGASLKGRAARVDARSFEPLRGVVEGETVRLPLLDGETVDGVVNIMETEPNGWKRIGGALPDRPGGTFTLAFNGREARGLIRFEKEQLAYEIAPERDNVTWMTERPLAEVLCIGLRLPAQERTHTRALAAGEPVPIRSSRPGAPSVLYLDFDGEVVRDSAWNNGQTITAGPARMPASDIEKVWRQVAEDYAPFNVDVTTGLARYVAMPAGRRMRCIITHPSAFAAGYTGIALIGSFWQSGRALSATVPCWVFADTDSGLCADAIAHELGHTFGLMHDGRRDPSEEYYPGHGDGIFGWSPIMGAPAVHTLSQWSRGEYPRANNQEDDVAKIASVLGFVPDEAGGEATAARPLKAKERDVRQRGVISYAGDEDVYSFTSIGGPLRIQASTAAIRPNLRMGLSLEDASGQVIAESVWPSALEQGLNQNKLPKGRYFLRVRGVGTPNTVSPGFSAYGSLGTYTLTGEAPLHVPLKITGPSHIKTEVYSNFSYSFGSNDPSADFFVLGRPPPGIEARTSRRVYSPAGASLLGNPSEPGSWELTVGAKGADGQLETRVVKIVVEAQIDDLATAINSPRDKECTTSASAPWTIDKAIKVDTYASARSGHVSDAQSSVLTTTCDGPKMLNFNWRVDSEAGGDFLIFRVDGVEQARISGMVEWQARAFFVTSGHHVVEWVYEKNESTAVGADAGWVDRWLNVGLEKPVITSAKSACGIAGSPFSYQTLAKGEPYIYFAELPSGLVMDSATGLITGSVLQPGVYTRPLRAENSHGSDVFFFPVTILDPNTTLAEVLATRTLEWISEGDAPWRIATDAVDPANGSAQAGAIADSAKSVLRTTVSGLTHVPLSLEGGLRR